VSLVFIIINTLLYSAYYAQVIKHQWRIKCKDVLWKRNKFKLHEIYHIVAMVIIIMMIIIIIWYSSGEQMYRRWCHHLPECRNLSHIPRQQYVLITMTQIENPEANNHPNIYRYNCNYWNVMRNRILIYSFNGLGMCLVFPVVVNIRYF
jgi:hypothetical protein